MYFNNFILPGRGRSNKSSFPRLPLSLIILGSHVIFVHAFSMCIFVRPKPAKFLLFFSVVLLMRSGLFESLLLQVGVLVFLPGNPGLPSPNCKSRRVGDFQPGWW